MAAGRAKPAAIVAAAQRLFLRHGLRGTSMDAISAEAGVAKETVYRYFRSKDRLFVEAVRQATIAPLQANIETLITESPSTSGPLTETLVALGERILDLILDRTHLSLVRIVIAESKDFPELGLLFQSAVTDGAHDALTRVLRSCAGAEGILMDDRAVLRLFWAPLLSYETEALLRRPDEVRALSRRELPTLVDLFVKAVTAPTGGHGVSHDTQRPASAGGS